MGVLINSDFSTVSFITRTLYQFNSNIIQEETKGLRRRRKVATDALMHFVLDASFFFVTVAVDDTVKSAVGVQTATAAAAVTFHLH